MDLLQEFGSPPAWLTPIQSGRAPGNTALMLLLLCALSACAPVPKQAYDTQTVEAIQKELETVEKQRAPAPTQPPQPVADALLPPLPGTDSAFADDGAERFDISASNLEARHFFASLVKDTDYNMVVHPDVQGSISLDLRNVTVDEVMDVVRDVYGYPYKKRGSLYQVSPAGMRTEVFHIDYLNLKRRGVSETTVSSGGVSEAGSSSSGNSNTNTSGESDNQENDGSGSRNVTIGTRIKTETDADFWQEVKQTLRMLIGADGNVVVTPQAGIIVVRAEPDSLAAVRDFLQRAEIIMRRQVVLEAKILEVELKDSFQSGIDWTALGSPGSSEIAFGVSSETVVSPENLGGVFGLAFDTGDFFGIIELLETQGNVQVLSSPRLSTVNNQKAVIKVGTDEFFVTEISNTTTTSSGTTTNNPEVELTPFFSGIALDVVPQISEENEIVLHVHPSVSKVDDQVKTIALGNATVELPLALSTIRESDSIVFARSGQVVVLGGLMQNRVVDRNAGVPLLSDIPGVGHLFTQQRSTTVKSELVILLKPIIMGPDGLPALAEEPLRRIKGFRDEIDRHYQRDSGSALY